MLNKSSIFLLLFCIGLIFVAGCASNVPKNSLQTSVPVQTPSLVASPIQSTTINVNHFEGSGISFDYPSSFTPLSSSTLQRMQSAFKSSGGELITMLTHQEGSSAVQIIRQNNPATIDSLYQDKKTFADNVNKGGYTINGMKVNQYNVELGTSKDGKKFVKGYAESESGAFPIAISYMWINNNYEYDINFLYPSATKAQSQSDTRDLMINSMKF